MPDRKNKPSIISISSHVARGSVGNRAAVFAVEAFGFPVWSVPTVLLPWHPGHGHSKRITPDDQEFSEFLKDIENANWIGEVGALLTGYIASKAQAEAISEMISALKATNKSLIYLCDPVMGDNGQLYVPSPVAETIRDKLLPLADVVTPNIFELGWLTNNQTPKTIMETLKVAQELDVAARLITSVPGDNDEEIGSLYLDERESWFICHQKISQPPNGMGDLLSATFLAHKLLGKSPADNLKTTTQSVLDILTQTKARQADELTLEGNVASLLKPKIDIPVKRLEIQR